MIKINHERIRKAQELMKKEGMLGLMIMNHDDYIYFFNDLRVQPRAIIPASGPPILVGFRAEEDELREQVKNHEIMLFSHVGEQISNIKEVFQNIFKGAPPGMSHRENPKVGMQMWFDTPAFLVDLFRKVNKQVELVPSDPVMDELRMVKDEEEIDKMKKAQSIAAKGMDTAKQLLKPGITGHELATEITYTMMKAGAEGTSTPMHINVGKRSCWIHGTVTKDPVKEGELVVIDLTPTFEGYCSNLARTFIIGQPDETQQKLFDTYLEMHEATRKELKPGNTPGNLDKMGKEICEKHGLGKYHIKGISHGIGLRFEENPASTIIPAHAATKLRKDMTNTVGHTVLAIPGVGGVRFEDIYRVTEYGGVVLYEYPYDYTI
ncbi:MAG: aminopeptidase P family protein [Bacteroidales bacterium]|nr:aminopeptidase P family protein [Bacteroidales bacterium]